MTYLSASEFEAYGLEATTLESWIAAASALIDAHCRRATLSVAQYAERVRLRGRNQVRVSYLPLATVAPATTPLISARARYGGVNKTMGAADAAIAFGLPGSWIDLDVNAIEVRAETGELTIACNVLGIPFSDLEVTYNAGFDEIPDAVKFACAQIVRNAQATPALNVRASNLDRMHLEYFGDTVIDQTVRALLAPYVAQRVG